MAGINGRRPRLGWALILAFATAAGALCGQDAQLVKAATIIDKHVTACGGKAAHLKILNRVLKARLVHVGMDMEDSLTEYRAHPHKTYVIIESEAFGRMEHGDDGKVAWRLTEERGPVIESKEVRQDRINKDPLHLLVGWRKRYQKVKCTGVEKVDGRPCYRVLMKPKAGQDETMLFDKVTGLLARVKASQACGGGPAMPVEHSLGDYRQLDGIRLPFKIRQISEACGAKRETLILTKSVKHNVKLPKDRFQPPLKVREFIKSGAKSPPCCEPKQEAKQKKSERSPSGRTGESTPEPMG